jgi:leucyl aminopeptidase
MTALAFGAALLGGTAMTAQFIQPDRGQDAIPIDLVDQAAFSEWFGALPAAERSLIDAQGFKGKEHQVALLPAGEGFRAVGGVANRAELASWCLAKLAEILPAGTYRLAGDRRAGPALLGWQTAQYRFDRYLSDSSPVEPRILLTGEAARIDAAAAEARAELLVRDLVNTPAEDMGPAALEAQCKRLADGHGGKLVVVRGDELEQEYPMVHAVGRAAARHHAPRLIHLTWGKESDPVVAIVGKGVCFDSGGLDVKSAAGMKLMKKDMGGAAHAIALAQLCMGSGLNIRLHLLVPAVENAIAGNAFRPGDVLKSRKGLSVEIGNTDAEGRLILADALARASEERPDLILDFATLTGAARVALGPDLPALMARRDETADALIAAGRQCDDECWRLPLPAAYAEYLESDIADTGNAHTNGFAGASVAGLFLDKFVDEGLDWAHFDTYAWRPAAKPGRSKGGAACGLRAAFRMLEERYRKG